MRISALSEEMRLDIEGRIERNLGEILSITAEYPEVQEIPDAGEDEKKTRVVWVERTEDYYIGKMNPGQSGKLVALLAALAVDGKKLQEAFGRKDMLVFLELLDETAMSLLASIIVGENIPWVRHNFDFAGWFLDAASIFIGKNDFLSLIEKVQKLASKWGLTGDAAKAFALEGKLPAKTKSSKPSDDTATA
jgi:hypothetical protein